MKEIVIHSFEELQQLVFDNCYDEKIGRYRNEFVYRGVFDADFKLKSKLQRICSHDLTLEDSIIRNFIKYGYAELGETQSIYQKLALGQHHGLPTRLLDWSYSPLVAAHFATQDIDKYDVDGAIYCLDVSKINRYLPSKLQAYLKQNRTQFFSVASLDRFFPTLDDLRVYSKEPFFLFFEPASQSDRIRNQYALFSLVSDTNYLVNDLIPDDIGDDVFYKIIIPKEVKLEIRDKLDYINISERFIFADLDGVCSWITRRYAKLGK
ncbi:MAG: FRG domain-containing protein [Erysipelotrichaceae bacterium]|nr:FRG domain-containing protein [Erysipelotrichaceae bacterium]